MSEGSGDGSREAEDARVGTSLPGVLHELNDRRRGLPRYHRLRLEFPGDTPFEAGQFPRDGAVKRSTRALSEIRAHNFDLCPICGSATDLTKEHVPQGEVGGQIMTLTCRDCNNKLGSRVEADLTDWHNGAMKRVSVEVTDVRGRRHSGRTLLRTAEDGRIAVMFDRMDPEIVAALNAGATELTLTWDEDPAARQLAVLKHAYLAACVYLRTIPRRGSAERIRAELIAARDTPSGVALRVGPEARRIQFYKTFAAPSGPPLALHEEQADDGESRRFLISLAGTLVVSWPFDDLFPAVPRRRSP
jgi:hypothetical protein